jgi:hypothetical protein
MTVKERRPDAWLLREDMLRVFDIKAGQVFDRNIRPFFPEECIRREPDGRRRLHFYARGCIEAWAAAKSIRADSASDPLLAGADSPALERYREERAKIARLDRLEREGSLVNREYVLRGLQRCASHIRGAGERLQAAFGPEALEILEEALEEFHREITASLEKSPEERNDHMETDS